MKCYLKTAAGTTTISTSFMIRYGEIYDTGFVGSPITYTQDHGKLFFYRFSDGNSGLMTLNTNHAFNLRSRSSPDGQTLIVAI